MAVKSIIDIEVNDAAFEKFAAAFKKYQEQLAKTPAAWADVGKKSQGSAVTFENLSAALLAQSVFAHELQKDSEKTTKTVERQASAWDHMARSTKTVAGHILSATRSLLRWGELTGVIGGLLGAGGLYGIDRLATSAGNLRRSGQGLGTSPGTQQAFGIAFGRLFGDNGKGFLSGVEEARTDVRFRGALLQGGLTSSQINPGRDTGDVAVDLLKSLKKLADRTPDALLGNIYSSRHVSQFMSSDVFRALKRMSGGEVNELGGLFSSSRERLGFSDASGKAWQDFISKLQEAGDRLQDKLIDHLTPLAGPLGELSDDLTSLAVKVLDMAKDDGWFDKLGKGIRWLGDEIQTPGFQMGFEKFADDIIKVVEALGKFIGWAAKHLPGVEGSRAPSGVPWFQGHLPLSPDERDEKNRSWWGPGLRPGKPGTGWFGTTPGISPASYRMGSPAEGAGDFGALDEKYGLPAGTLNTVEGIESGHGRRMVSSAGAEGWFQFMPGTWRQEGQGSPYNRRDASIAAAKYLHKLLGEFGDISKAVAGYDAGPGRVEEAIRKLGSRWLSGLPQETQNYVRKFFANSDSHLRDRATYKVRIDVNNYAGANHSISSSQLVRT